MAAELDFLHKRNDVLPELDSDPEIPIPGVPDDDLA